MPQTERLAKMKTAWTRKVKNFRDTDAGRKRKMQHDRGPIQHII